MIKTCAACGHTNFAIARACAGCGAAFERKQREVSIRNLAIVWAIALLLILITAGGLYLMVQQVLPPLRALILGS